MISVYANKTAIEANPRRIELMEKYNKLIQWGRANPTRFIELVFKIELIDYQKWMILNTWTAEKAVWVCSRNAGKSFLLAVYIQARSILFAKHKTYLMGPTSRQSGELFQKLEDIALHNIASLLGTSDVFWNELVKSNSNTDGFTHGSSGCECSLYNGSTITSLVGGSGKTVVSFRSNLNVYDEAGKIEDAYFELTEPFTAQSTDFKTGGGFDERIFPREAPTQCIYASSAESVDTYLWKMYKDCAMNMLMGVPGFFVADVSCELPLHPTLNGIAAPPLLKQSEIDSAMRANESKALREYYNIFDITGGNDAAVSRSAILRNTLRYLPVNFSQGGNKKYVICWDPALQADNSTVLIMEIYRDEQKGLKGKIVNSINLIDVVSSTVKRPLRTPEQVEWIRKIVLAFNGDAPFYHNVEIYIDAGAGGGGRQYADLLMSDWVGADGKTYPGFIDMSDEASKEQRTKFPRAIECLHLIEPKRYKNLMYGALGEMTSQDLIDFPDTDVRVTDALGNIEKELEDGTKVHLVEEEVRALIEIDLMKEELMSMQKMKSPAGNLIYRLSPSKERKMHDDRAYTAALAAYHLSEQRRLELVSQPKSKADFSEYLAAMATQRIRNPMAKQSIPFQGQKNPFAK